MPALQNYFTDISIVQAAFRLGGLAPAHAGNASLVRGLHYRIADRSPAGLHEGCGGGLVKLQFAAANQFLPRRSIPDAACTTEND